MGWLLELLLDGIREICSQFIVDMMELVTEMFTELLSCNLSLFEELFSVVSALYKNVIVPMGIAMLLLILVWQLFKSMFGKSVNGEEPVELVIRSAIALFFVVAAKPIVNYILRFAGTPYQWVVGTEIEVESFSGFVSALEGVTETLGIGKLSISILMLIMQFVVAWNYFKMLFVIAERYVLLGVFSYTAPLAFSTGGSKSTNNILASWSKMFGGQVVLIILNAWCMKMFLSGYGNLMASSYGFTKFFVATLCLVGFCKITFKLDSYLASLGVNLGRPSAGMGAMGLIMAASRIISQIGRGGAGDGGRAPAGGADTSREPEEGMPEGFTGPIPMMPGSAPGSGMDMPEGSPEGGFDEAPDIPEDSGVSGTSGYPEQETAGGSSVLEELGVAAAETAEGSADAGIRTDSGIGRTEIVGMENSPALENLSGDSGVQVSGSEDGASMDMNISGIPEYTDGGDITNGDSTASASGALNGQAAENGIGMSVREASESAAPGNGYGNGNAGIISEIGDYPVDEELSDGADEDVMELDGSTIDSMGSGQDAEGVSYGNAGDAYGNASLASGKASGNGTDFHSNTAGGIPGIGPSGGAEGIISEVGADFGDGSIGSTDGDTGGTGMDLGGGSIGPYGTSETAGGSGNPEEGAVSSERDGSGVSDGFGLSGEADGHTGGSGGMDFESGSIAPYSVSDAEDGNGDWQQNVMGTGDGTKGTFDDSGFSDAAGDRPGNAAGYAGEGMTPHDTAEEDVDGKTLEDGMASGENAADALSGITPPEEMRGQMNHTQTGGPIPAGNQKENRRRKPAREFWEVPKNREELRRRQKEQKMPDGMLPK